MGRPFAPGIAPEDMEGIGKPAMALCRKKAGHVCNDERITIAESKVKLDGLTSRPLRRKL